MSETEKITVGEALPRLASVEAGNAFDVIVTWAEGSRVGKRDIIDLAPHIFSYKIFRPLRENPDLFRSVRLGEWSASIEWGNGDAMAVPAAILEDMAEQAMSNEDFCAFLSRHRLTFDSAAAQLGISRRQVAYYAKEKMIPRVIALACAELERRLAAPPPSLTDRGWSTVGATCGGFVTAANGPAYHVDRVKQRA